MAEATPKRAPKTTGTPKNTTTAKAAAKTAKPTKAAKPASTADAVKKVSTAKPKATATPRTKKATPTNDLRQRMIIETAYFLSEKRRCDAGELDDWLFAERLVDTLLLELK